MNMLKSFTLAALVSLICFTSYAEDKELTKNIIKKWKMIKTEENGQEITPKHNKLILDISKKGAEFTISAEFEETHKGTWTLDGYDLTLTDTETQEVKKLTITEADGKHLTLAGFDGEGTVVHFVPASGKKATILTHKEFMVAKKWTIYKSDKETNVGTRIEFKQDMTFVLLPWGYKVPTMSGNWKLSNDNTKLIIDSREDNQHIEISVVELHKHKLILKFDDLGITEHLHDPKYAKKDKEMIAAAHKNDK